MLVLSVISFQFSFMVFMSFKHPISMALSLIISAISLSGVLGCMLSSWLTLALVLIFLGGMMVIFLYFSSLVSNEKPFIAPLFKSGGLSTFFVLFCVFPVSEMKAVEFIKFNYLNSNFSLILFLTFYLLICLFLVVKFCESFKGALSIKFL